MKFEAIYDTPFWRDEGLNGQAVSENGPVKVDLRHLARRTAARRS